MKKIIIATLIISPILAYAFVIPVGHRPQESEQSNTSDQNDSIVKSNNTESMPTHEEMRDYIFEKELERKTRYENYLRYVGCVHGAYRGGVAYIVPMLKHFHVDNASQLPKDLADAVNKEDVTKECAEKYNYTEN